MVTSIWQKMHSINFLHQNVVGYEYDLFSVLCDTLCCLGPPKFADKE